MELTIRDERAPGRPVSSLVLADLPSRLTARDLIRARVREEVVLYNAAPTREFRLLVQPLDAEVYGDGFRFTEPRWLDWETQANVAIEAFDRNGFILLVDDRQVAELDEELELDADSEVRFLRLVPLVGG